MKKYEEINEEELKALTTAIKSRYGIDFTSYEIKSLTRGFGRVISKNGMNSLLDLWSKILKDKAFFLGCIDELTVNLTEMFRNPEVWLQLREEILPMYSKKLRLNVWHAGCSTGEEVYTMAYILNTANMLVKAKATASDLSPVALEKAKAGEYSKIIYDKYKRNFVKNFPNEDLTTLFDELEGKSSIKTRFRRYAEFKEHNLVSDVYPAKMDIIFCRNVMIYFDDKLKVQVLKKFYDNLADDGFLIIGYYDMLPEDAKQYFQIYDSKTKLFRKKLD